MALREVLMEGLVVGVHEWLQSKNEERLADIQPIRRRAQVPNDATALVRNIPQ